MITFTANPGDANSANDTTSNGFQVEEADAWGLNSLIGRLSGTFTISPYYDILTGVREASVSGTGTLSIYGQAANPLAAGLAPGTYDTLPSGPGLGLTNLKEFSYSGSDAALLSLVDGTTGVNTLTFQFIPAGSLASLTSGGTLSSVTFAGSLVAIPESPVSAMLLGCTALGFAILRHRNRMRPVG